MLHHGGTTGTSPFLREAKVNIHSCQKITDTVDIIFLFIFLFSTYDFLIMILILCAKSKKLE